MMALRRPGSLFVRLVLMVAFCYLSCGISGAHLDIVSPCEGSKATFNDWSPGYKMIFCTADAGDFSHPVSVTWSCEDIPETWEWWSPGAFGSDTILWLTELPPNNSDFGDTWVHATSSEGSDTNHFKLFFSKDATNNPGGTLPNWYYYWSQTSAAYGTHNYDSTNMDESGYTQFESGVWRSYICHGASHHAVTWTWNYAEGIDYFANICRHEERHRQDMSSLWGSYYDPANDPDQDGLPTDNGTVTENSLGTPFHAGGYDPNRMITIGLVDHFNYGSGWKDSEDYCLHREAAWTNGSADSVDWANPGHQY